MNNPINQPEKPLAGTGLSSKEDGDDFGQILVALRLTFGSRELRDPTNGDFEDRKALTYRAVEAAIKVIGAVNQEPVERLLTSSASRLLAGLATASLEDASMDRLERMKLKGAERFEMLIEGAGGAFPSERVATLLGISEEAVRKRAQRRNLIAKRTSSGELRFPCFQFDVSSRKLIPGLQRVLRQMEGVDQNEIIRFFLVPHEPSFSNETPSSLLKRGEVDRVVEMASGHLSQRA